MVWSGDTRRSVLKTNRIEEKAKNYQNYAADIIMPAPTLNFNPGLRDELTRLIPVELRMMEKEFAAEYERQLNKRGRTNQETTTYRAAA